jgi:hypothetical protein
MYETGVADQAVLILWITTASGLPVNAILAPIYPVNALGTEAVPALTVLTNRNMIYGM